MQSSTPESRFIEAEHMVIFKLHGVI